MNLESWGRYPYCPNQKSLVLEDRNPELSRLNPSILPRGFGRSYGDSCLNDNGTLLLTHSLDHFLEFDESTGVLCCEAGVGFDEILKIFVPRGWFVPVTPGTKYVSVGGAIANDVHGKNHHTRGTIAHHIQSFELLRSNGERLLCSPHDNVDLFRATIGGLGLTGLITWAKLKLIPIQSALIDQEQITFDSLEEFLEISRSSSGFEYTVSWVDCVGGPRNTVRGIFIRGNHSINGSLKVHGEGKLTVPFNFPNCSLNRFSMRTFNEFYYRKNFSKKKSNQVHYDPFFYPLDSIRGWNRIYGKRGFLQYQLTVPSTADGIAALKAIFQNIKATGWGSFLAVLKEFGTIPSLGMLSYPRPGLTLALDFPNHGSRLLAKLEELDSAVAKVGGNVYPAKDARMSGENFRKFYPAYAEFTRWVDPHFSSSFWRRVQ